MHPKIGIAAGMIKQHEYLPHRLLSNLAHVTVGSYTLHARAGNPDPTTWEAPNRRWMLNAIGLQNGGLLDFLDNQLGPMREVCEGVTDLRVSLAPTKSGELAEMVALLNEHDAAMQIAELEINAACPNHRTGAGIQPVLAHDVAALEGLFEEAADYVGAKAVKIAPQTDYDVLMALIELCDAYDIRTIVSANTLKHTAVIEGRQRLSVESGGLSGDPLFTDCLEQTTLLAHLIEQSSRKIRVVSCGGVLSADNALRLLAAGAAEVQVATLFWLEGEKGLANLVTQTALTQAE